MHGSGQQDLNRLDVEVAQRFLRWTPEGTDTVRQLEDGEWLALREVQWKDEEGNSASGLPHFSTDNEDLKPVEARLAKLGWFVHVERGELLQYRATKSGAPTQTTMVKGESDMQAAVCRLSLMVAYLMKGET